MVGGAVLRTYGTSRVFPECGVCGHPRVSHAAGTCFCGCTGRKAAPEAFPLDPAPSVHSAASRDGWTHDEDTLLEQRYLDGTLISQLSRLHERRPSAIIQRLEQLGLVEPRRRIA